MALVFAQLGERRLRTGLAALLDRRLVAPQALRRYLASGPRDLTAAAVCRRAAERFRDAFDAVDGGLEAFLADGPVHAPSFVMLSADIRTLCAPAPGLGAATAGDGSDANAEPFERRDAQAHFRVLADRLRAYFLKADGAKWAQLAKETGIKID